jgi:hypothetical protein
MLQFLSREQCEQFQMMHFGISCATCECSDVECPWQRQDKPTTIARPRKANLRMLGRDFAAQLRRAG